MTTRKSTPTKAKSKAAPARKAPRPQTGTPKAAAAAKSPRTAGKKNWFQNVLVDVAREEKELFKWLDTGIERTNVLEYTWADASDIVWNGFKVLSDFADLGEVPIDIDEVCPVRPLTDAQVDEVMDWLDRRDYPGDEPRDLIDLYIDKISDLAIVLCSRNARPMIIAYMALRKKQPTREEARAILEPVTDLQSCLSGK